MSFEVDNYFETEGVEIDYARCKLIQLEYENM